ncbi:AAA family ATPase [Candidatus Thioglobus sp.]|nr:AAA family ATPase [Candidatus Thioglobus sp.]
MNGQQKEAVDLIIKFVSSSADCFILKGSAGTGKTSLVKYLLNKLDEQKHIALLMAPTGRSARILNSKTAIPAKTIHAHIYALDKIQVDEDATNPDNPGYADSNDSSHRFYFPLKENEPQSALFIIDESSMIGDLENKGDLVQFGSGKLLSDLIQYARIGRYGHISGERVKILFIGDPTQLPPVSESNSPALSKEYLTNEFNVVATGFNLTKVMRQAEGGEILTQATKLRDSIIEKQFNSFSLKGNGSEIQEISTQNAIDTAVESMAKKVSVAFVTYTNKQALTLNQSIRERIFSKQDLPMQVGDTLLVNKNSPLYSLNNGDLIKVVNPNHLPEVKSIRMKGVEHPVELSFRDVLIAYRDFNGAIIRSNALILENLLTSNERELSAAENRALMIDFRSRHKALKTNSKEFKAAIGSDKYFNALQVKFGYALTCHKAQGGEWDTVIVDFSDARGNTNESYFRWSYTAITRASKKLLTISAPSFNEVSTLDWNGTAPPYSNVNSNSLYSEIWKDPDWVRFSFIKGQEALFANYEKISKLLLENSLNVASITHNQYCEDYLISSENNHVNIQYWYNAKGSVSKIAIKPVSRADMNPDLNEETLKLFNLAIFDETLSFDGQDEFFLKFKRQLSSLLKDSNISIVSIRALAYCYRIEFDEEGHKSQIDFFYNNKKQWTKAQEVGGDDSSKDLKKRLEALFKK